MRGTDIMVIGSAILIVIVLLTPREYLLSVAIPFVIVEFTIACYFTLKNNKKTKSLNTC